MHMGITLAIAPRLWTLTLAIHTVALFDPISHVLGYRLPRPEPIPEPQERTTEDLFRLFERWAFDAQETVTPLTWLPGTSGHAIGRSSLSATNVDIFRADGPNNFVTVRGAYNSGWDDLVANKVASASHAKRLAILEDILMELARTGFGWGGVDTSSEISLAYWSSFHSEALITREAFEDAVNEIRRMYLIIWITVRKAVGTDPFDSPVRIVSPVSSESVLIFPNRTRVAPTTDD